MSKRRATFLLMLILAMALSLGGMIACSERPPEPPPPQPPAPVPAAPNDSIVIAKVIALQGPNNNTQWELTIEVEDSQDVPGYLNATRQKIGQQMVVRTDEEVSRLKGGEIITAHVRLEGDERIRFYYAWDIQYIREPR